MSRNDAAEHLVILHSNDIHGACSPKIADGHEIGGLSLLSGYVRRVREQEDNVIYAIAGDLFMGSIIDREYRGLSTIRLANALQPDVFAVGNHEIDYGLSHLLFLEKCADFPIVCANMNVRELNRCLFAPYIDIERGGRTVRFIGLLTESIAGRIQQEDLVDQAISVRDVYKELIRVLNGLKTAKKADCTVLLTHIGITEDRILASRLSPDLGVDMIIGGHSHTLMQEPEIVNGIPIVQAGSGSSQIGRFDIDWDRDTGMIRKMSWKLIPVNDENSENDLLIDFYEERFHKEVDRKYEKTILTMPAQYKHDSFHRETEVIDLFTDMYRDAFGTDLFLLSSNAIRCKLFGPEIRRKDLLMALPYDNEVFRVTMDGARLQRLFAYFLRKEAWEGVNIYIFFSGNAHVLFDKEERFVREVRIGGEVPDPSKYYTVGITSYLYKNLAAFLDIKEDELPIVKIAEDDRSGLERYLMEKQSLSLRDFGRLEFV